MNAKPDTRSYDLFKLIVAIILALIALLLLLRAPKANQPTAAVAAPTATVAVAAPTTAPVQAEVNLPEFPAANFQWKFDKAKGLLLDPNGKALFRLDADAGKWIPVVPDDLLGSLPEGFQVAEVDGAWQITGPDGKRLYRWNSDTMSWEAVEETVTANLPEFPTADFQWNFDKAKGLLLTPDGKAIFRLDPDSGKWVPIVPDDLQASLPEGFQVAEVDGAWQITGPDGKLLYRWNPDTMSWEAVETAETSTGASNEETSTAASSACAAHPARLSVGDSAKVLTNLNLRLSPGIGDNWIMTMPAGTVVEIIGGPECVPYGDGAYRWWNVRLSDGRTGWAAEAPIHGDYYFLEPIQ
ncbi:MAG: SH3 domain-containing protein [Chloroflexi bacterium]|nr:SH3 domain-containing protein [Chloroflexota bacterium]